MFNIIDPIYLPIIIFVLRVANNAVGTVRVIVMHEGRRSLGFALASLESLLFAYTAGMVITDLNNIPNLTAYVLGFAVGGYVGMFIEQRFLNIFNIVDIVADDATAHEIALALREDNHGVTEMHGEGARGHVTQLRVVAHHRDVKAVLSIARSIKPNCFITVEESRFIRGGWVRSQHQHQR
ncbi:MAG: hypothetical protein Phog2KO_12550 [Phototrophicaceae bacterium]